MYAIRSYYAHRIENAGRIIKSVADTVSVQIVGGTNSGKFTGTDRNHLRLMRRRSSKCQPMIPANSPTVRPG